MRQPDQPQTPHPETTAILLIAHGSRQDAANQDLVELVKRLSARGAYPIVEGCFLELAEPDVPTGGDRCVARGTRVLLIPYFLSAGVHLERDLTAARDELTPPAPARGVSPRPRAGAAPAAR